MLRRRQKPIFIAVLLFAVILMTALSLATVFHLIPSLETNFPEFSAEEYLQLCDGSHSAWFPRKSGNGLSFLVVVGMATALMGFGVHDRIPTRLRTFSLLEATPNWKRRWSLIYENGASIRPILLLKRCS